MELGRLMGKLGKDPIMVSREYAEDRVRCQIVGLLERRCSWEGSAKQDAEVSLSQSAGESGILASLVADCSKKRAQGKEVRGTSKLP